MDMSPAWLSGMEMEDAGFMNLYNSVDNFSVDSFSSESYSENMQFIDQSVQIQQPKIKLHSYQETNSSPTTNSLPDAATIPSSSNTFTISFGDPKHKDDGILQFCDSGEATKVPFTVRNQIQAKDHVLAERKRREKLNRHFISLSALLPNLTKMDKVTLLESASKHIKELQSRVKELERLQGTKRKDVQESFISMKRSRLSSTSDDEHYSSTSDETISGDQNCRSGHHFKPLSPEIEVRMSGSSVLVRIQCQKDFSCLVKALTQMQNLGMSIISSSAMPFANTTLLITIVAQIEDDFCMTTTELVNNLQLVISRSICKYK